VERTETRGVAADPRCGPGRPCGGSIVVAAVLIVELGVVFRLHWGSNAEASAWLAYRFGIPLAAAGILALGGVGMLLGWSLAVWAPALFVFATVIVGVQDAWDLLIVPDTPVQTHSRRNHPEG
jgi:hypothetical protein